MSGRNVRFVFGFQSTCCNGLGRNVFSGGRGGIWCGERRLINWHACGRDLDRTDTISWIPSCLDDPYNHCNNHPLYVHSELLFFFFFFFSVCKGDHRVVVQRLTRCHGASNVGSEATAGFHWDRLSFANREPVFSATTCRMLIVKSYDTINLPNEFMVRQNLSSI